MSYTTSSPTSRGSPITSTRTWSTPGGCAGRPRPGGWPTTEQTLDALHGPPARRSRSSSASPARRPAPCSTPARGSSLPGAGSGRAMFIFATEGGTILGWNPACRPRRRSTAAPETWRGLQGPRDRRTAGGPALRDRLPQRPRGRLRLRAGSPVTRRARSSIRDCPRLRPVRDPDHRRPRSSSPTRSRTRTATTRSPARGSASSTCSTRRHLLGARRAARPAQRAVGPRPGARELRPLRRRSARRQLRRRADQRLRGAAERQLRAPRRAARTRTARPLAIDGLWALEFGKGAANNGPLDTLFFTAGPNDEADGLFGTIRAG